MVLHTRTLRRSIAGAADHLKSAAQVLPRNPESMPDDIRQMARDKVEQGLLPREAPRRVGLSRGWGRSCSVCELPISAQEMGYEVQLGQPLRQHFFHSRCHAAGWRAETSGTASRCPPLHLMRLSRAEPGAEGVRHHHNVSAPALSGEAL
jgi:hypothetical protein